MGVVEVGPAIDRRQPIGGGEVNSETPFFRGHTPGKIAELGSCFDLNSHRVVLTRKIEFISVHPLISSLPCY
jgi:hypothetical protein